MKKVANIDNYSVYILDRKTAEKYKDILTTLVDQIPLVHYTSKDILSENKGERKFYGKWEHSLIVLDKEKPIAILIAYERASENTEQYPENSIYISELAVGKNYQGKGIAKKLLKIFFDANSKEGLRFLPGSLAFSIQTNSAEWNSHVQNLYKSFGFMKRTMKQYNNRTDVILGWKPIDKFRKGTVCYIRDKDKILLALIEYSPTNRRWNGIGGYVEEGESLEDAIVREALEETCIIIDKNSLKKVAELNLTPIFQLNVFFADKWDGELKIKEPSLKELKWFLVDEIPYTELPEGNDTWLPKVLAGKLIKMNNGQITEVLRFD